MAGGKRFRRAQIVVFCFALAVMVFILIVGMSSHATLSANVFLGVFFIGWVPAVLVLEYATRRGGAKSPQYSSRVRIAVVVVSVLVAAATSVFVVPLLAYPLTPAVTVFLMILGFLPTSALALIRSPRKEPSPT